MTKITDYLATVTDVNSVFPAKGAAVPNSERCVIKDETGETTGSVGAVNNWQIDLTANPLVTYTNPRLPRWQDLVPLITTTTTTTIILNCNFTFNTLQVPVVSTTTTTTSTSTSTTTTTTTLPLNEWYILYNCSNGQSYNSAEYAANTFELNDRVTSGGVFYYVTGIINYNPSGTLLSITAVAGQTFCPPVSTTTTTTNGGGGFGGGTRYDDTVFNTIIQSNGDISSVGYFHFYNSISQFIISVLNSNGSINSSFNNGFSFPTGGASTIEQQKIDNKLIVGGNFTNYNSAPTSWGIMRLYLDGSVDNSFNSAPNFESPTLSGVWAPGGVLAVKTQLDGKMVLGGTFTRIYGALTCNRIIRLNSNGSVDFGFTIGPGFNNNIYQHGIQLQSDNKLIINGAFETYNGISANGIIRLNTDGTKDTSFNYGTGFARTGLGFLAYASAFQSSGKIITVGIFERYNGTASNNIVRINTDGSIDNTFAVGTGLSAVAICVAVQSDDKILVGGNFTSYNGNASIRLVRLNSNGTYDNTFNVGTGFGTAVDAYVETIVIQSDGKIVVSGAFTTYNGTTVNRIVRLNTDGSINN